MAETVRFQHFEVLRKEDGSLYELGRGAMGITYKAFDTNLRSHVALKVINAAYLNSEVARQRFLREARAAAALRHPNVAAVFHLGSEDDNYFYAMEFIDGETVEGFMKREGAVPAAMALEIAAQVSRALGAAEKQGLVHRDIKPSNLMLVREDERDFTVKVIDFGLAKNANKESGEDSATLTAGGFLGTPHFASPEQLEEREIDVRSDIYSLGVTLWYMLAGKTPFSGSLAQVMSQHLHREPPFETLEGQPSAVLALLRHMMAKNPKDRPQTPAELRREIEGCLAEIEAAPGRPGAMPPTDENFDTTILPQPMQESAGGLATGHVLAERYRLLGEITASDHGRMFRAERLEDKAAVALLILDSERLATSEAYTRLEQDVEKLQRLKEPVFQHILSLEREHHYSFLVLEWVEGPALLDLLRARKALPAEEAARLLRPLAAGFDELAAAGLNCPDIGAHEILLPGAALSQPVTAWTACRPKFLPLATAGVGSFSPEATMVASSFALLKESGAFAGNPRGTYVCAVACLAYEMLGGVKAGSSMGSYVPIPGLSEEGNAALRKAFNPAQGFPSALALVEALAEGSGGARAPAAPALTPPPLPVPEKKGPPVFLWAGVGAGLLVTALAIAAFVFFKGGASSQPEPPPPAATPTPVASLTPPPEPTPEATPQVDPRQVAYEQALAVAQGLQQQGNLAGALAAYADIATQYPEQKAPLDTLETLAAGLRSNTPKPTAEAFAALRQPLEKAAALKVVSAQLFLGEALRESEPAEALKRATEAANSGNTEAMVYVGKLTADGHGLPARDLPGAVGWFRKAADLRYPPAMYLLAECLLNGKGVEKDPKRATELLIPAAEWGDPMAMNLLGNLYRKGIPDVLQKNPAEAFQLFTKAKDAGFLDAQGNLGVLCILGEGTEKDPAKALALFKSGAEQGNPSCMYYFAMCLQDGVGVAPDPAQARDWLVKAATGGDRRAIDWCKKNAIPFGNSP